MGLLDFRFIPPTSFAKPIYLRVEFDQILQAYKAYDITIPDRVAQAVALAVAKRKGWKFAEPVDADAVPER